MNENRASLGKRLLGLGMFRPFILLYGDVNSPMTAYEEENAEYLAHILRHAAAPTKSSVGRGKQAKATVFGVTGTTLKISVLLVFTRRLKDKGVMIILIDPAANLGPSMESLATIRIRHDAQVFGRHWYAFNREANKGSG